MAFPRARLDRSGHFERKLGEQSQVEAVASLLDTHAKLTEGVVKASVSATRELITA